MSQQKRQAVFNCGDIVPVTLAEGSKDNIHIYSRKGVLLLLGNEKAIVVFKSIVEVVPIRSLKTLNDALKGNTNE